MNKSFKITAFGDFHLNPFNEFSRSIEADGNTSFSRDLIETAEFIKHAFLKNQSDVLLVNGDLTHTPGILNSSTLKLIREVEKIWGVEVPRFYNIGNHDLDNKVGLHNLLLHSLIDGVVGVAGASSVTHYKGIFVVPFTYSIEEQRTLLRGVPDGSVVMVHTPIIGIHMGANVPESVGVPVEDFRRFRLTIASHYHLPQVHYADGTCEIVNNDRVMVCKDVPSGTLVMMGTPHPHSFSDTNPKYGVWNFEIPEKKLGKISFEMVDNKRVKRFYSVKADELSTLQDLVHNIPHDSYVSVQVPEEIFTSFQETNFQTIFPNSKVRKLKAEKVINKEVYEDSTGNVVRVVSDFLNTKEDIRYEKDKILQFISPIVDSAPLEVKIGGNVIFKNLKLKNFLSWGEAEVRFGNDGLFLISGTNLDTESSDSNGSGKTSLFESLIWCIYGEPFRDIESKDSIIRSGAKDGCLVSVEFINESGTFKITRYRKDKELGTGVSIAKLEDFVSWKDVSRGSIANVDSQIIDTIGLPYDLFNTVTYFSSHNNSRFTTLGDVDRKKFLSKLFDLGRYEYLRNAVKKKNSEVSSAVELLSHSLSQSEGTVSRLLEKKTQEEKNIEEEKEKNSKELLSSTTLMEICKEEVEEISKELDGKLAELRAVEEEKNKCSVKISTISSKKSLLEGTMSDKASSLLTITNSLRKISTKIEAKQSEITSVNTLCPTCGKEISEDVVSSIRNKLAVQLEELILEKLELEQSKGNSEASFEKAKKDLEIFVEENEELESLFKNLGSDWSIKKTSVNVTEKEKTFAVAKVASLLSKIEKLNSVDYDRVLESINSTISDELKEQDKIKENLAKEKKQFEFISFLYNLFGGKELISFVMESGIREFNSYLADISSEICGADYAVQLDTIKELKSGGEDNKITIRYTTNAGNYGASSDGEKRKADLSIFLAFNALSQSMGRGSTNILVADEALDSLDTTASKIVVTTLSDFANENRKSIFLISHSDYVTPFVSEVITVIKSEGISRIKNGIDL